jgi:hypothetical protein
MATSAKKSAKTNQDRFGAIFPMPPVVAATMK